MEIDFIVGISKPDFNVIRNAFGKILKIELDYRLTLLEIHHLSCKLLSADEYASYAALMMPKPACTHVDAGYKATHG